jgi:hypothetical protein
MMLSTGHHTLTSQHSELDDNDGDSPYYNKHCILVKLTDSSAKAIEEYLRSKDSSLGNKKPSIAFQRDRGVINALANLI